MKHYVLCSLLLVSSSPSPCLIAYGLGHVACVGQWNVGGDGISFRAEMLAATARLGWSRLVSVLPVRTASWLHHQFGFGNEAELMPIYISSVM